MQELWQTSTAVARTEEARVLLAKHLTADGVPSPAGRDIRFSGTVKSILTHEKYTGDALLQKTYMVDILSKRMKANDCEVPQYYVENSHPAIISPEVFEMVQAEMKRRKTARFDIRVRRAALVFSRRFHYRPQHGGRAVCI
jgi:hypothetical protein